MTIISGIYQIFNTINGKSYIGSSVNIHERWNRHKYELNNGRHHSDYLQRAWNKYGPNNFELIILFESTGNLLILEKQFIDRLKPEYNVGSVGGGDNISNHPRLEEIKNQHRENYHNGKSGLANYPKARFGKDNPNWKGGVCSPNCIDCGKPISQYTTRCSKCSKIGSNNPFAGKSHSNDTKSRISNSKKGQKPYNSLSIIIDGRTYLSFSDAAKALGVTTGTISYRVKKGIYTVISPKSTLP